MSAAQIGIGEHLPAVHAEAEHGVPRVLFIIPGKDPGPAANHGNSMIFARRQAETLCELGADAKVFFLRSRTSPRLLLREFRRFRKTMRQERSEVIHAHFGTVTAVFAALACGELPLVITYRGSDLNPAPTSHGVRPFLGRLLSQIAALRAARIVCVSRQLRARLWWRRDRAVVLPSGVDPRMFRPEDQTAARARIGWNPTERVILFNAGGDARNKRLDLAKAAVEIARASIADLRLEVLNGGQDPTSIPTLMNAADCLLITSDAEGSPTVIQEALASNLPIVSVDAGDAKERLEGVLNCRLTERNPQAIAAALVELTAEPLRSNGRSRIKEISSLHIAASLCRIYRAAGGAV